MDEVIIAKASELLTTVRDWFNTKFNNHTNNKNNPHDVTKTQIGLSNVTNDKQVKGLNSGTTEGNLVVWGTTGYDIKDGGAISNILPNPVLGNSTSTTNPTSKIDDPYLNLVENNSNISGQIKLEGDGVGTNISATNGVLKVSSNGIVTAGDNTTVGYLITPAQYKSILDRLQALEETTEFVYGYGEGN